MKTVRQMLADKKTGVVSVGPGSSVYEALTDMAERNVGAIMVVDGGKVVGILSERDYARKMITQSRNTKEVKVSEIMTEKVIYVTPDQTVDQCMALMTDKRIRHLPVMDDGRLVGVISVGDLVKESLAEKEFVIQELERYIMS